MRALIVVLALPFLAAEASAEANTFNVQTFGARPDGKTDSTAAFQRAVNSAAAAVKLWPHGTGGATVYVPAGPQPYKVSAPVFVHGNGIEIRGGGRGSIVEAIEGNPVFVVGKMDGGKSFGASYRPDAFGVLDRSAAPQAGARFGVATRGDAALIVPAHPLTFGHGWPYPDYWAKTSQLTLEFYLARPPAARWQPWTRLFGFSRDQKYGLPWSVSLGESTDELVFHWRSAEMTNEQESRQLVIPLGSMYRGWRVTIQADLAGARYAAWVNGRKVDCRVSSATRSPVRPDQTFPEHDGYTQFLIGALGPAAPYGNQKTTPLILYGLRVAKGLVYKMDQPTETFADDSARPVTDANRYFWNLARVENVKLIGLFPLDDAPGAPTVKLTCDGPDASAFWVNASTAETPTFCALRDLQVRGRLQPAVLLGRVLDFSAERLTAENSYQGIGSLNSGASWTIHLSECTLSGYDAAYYGYQQTISARNTRIRSGGRETVRLRGCNSTWDQTNVAFVSANAATAFRFLSDEYGGMHRLVDLFIDNEGGTTFREAAIEADQMRAPSHLIVDGMYIVEAGKYAAIVRLNGFGEGGGLMKSVVDVRSIISHVPNFRAALEVKGKGWSGRFNASELAHGEVIGDAEKIQVTLPAEFP
jgi:hypothetical protein